MSEAGNGYLFVGGTVLLPGKQSRGLAVSVEGSRITAVGKDAERRGRRRARQLKRVHLGGAFLAPGFIDLHTHGARGVWFDSVDAHQLEEILRDHYIRHGVTRLLVSLCPAPKKLLVERTRRVAAAIRARVGAGVAGGIHLEGPFVSPERPGALPREHFRSYSARFLDELLDAGGGTVKTMTFAPECPGGGRLIAHLRRRRVVPAFGHSTGGHADAEAAVKAGVRYVTHLFNAMRSIHHRDPGPVPVFLSDRRVRCELISDGFHVSPEVMRWVAEQKAAEEICLVSDSGGPCGLRSGTYRFDGRSYQLRGGRLTLTDGTLAGSALTLDRAIRIQVERVGRSPQDAAVSASQVPARIVGWERTRGVIAPGKRADLVVLTPRFRVLATYVGGDPLFQRR